MIKNIIVYLCMLLSVFIFNIFYYAWFSWFLLVAVLSLPLISLVVSLPFMITSAANGFIIFAKDNIISGEDFYIGIACKKRNTAFCPLMRVKIKAYNTFTNKKENINITYGGSLRKAVFAKFNKLGKNCGCIILDAKHFKIYDIMGIFFIPVRTDSHISVNIMPKPQKTLVMPNYENIAVLGYKPKSGGGFSDFYELRQYQNGDSIKNIHWKLSSKHDDLIVREPCQPIYKKFAIKLELTDNSNENDSILAKFLYVCDCVFKNGSDCFVLCKGFNFVSLLTDNNDAQMYIKSLYNGIPYKECLPDKNNFLVYSIFGEREEVN